MLGDRIHQRSVVRDRGRPVGHGVRILRQLGRSAYSLDVLKKGNERRIEEFEGPPELARFFKAGHLETIPSSRADRIAVLRHLALRFEPGREYHESEVNRILQGVHADHAMLRRYLVDEKLLRRASGRYRRV